MPAFSAPDEHLHQAARGLRLAASSRLPVPAIRTLIGPADTQAAYYVQRLNVDQRLQGGDSIIGRKIGLTSAAVQRQLGVDEPDFGTLLDSMRVPNGGIVDSSQLLQARIEGEIAFELAESVTTVPADPQQLVGMIRCARPALEIVDSRIEGWDITIVDTIADNASSGLFVLGESTLPVDMQSLAAVTMRMERNGGQVSSGCGADCLGNPLLSLHWLASTMAAMGDPLQAGDIVLSGALGPMCPVAPGDHFTATFGERDVVMVRFSEGATS